jgi:hypothetical protein
MRHDAQLIQPLEKLLAAVKIYIYTKEFKHAGTLRIEADFVPRVGDKILLDPEIGMDALQGTEYFLVQDVVYILTEQKLTPVVHCLPSDECDADRRALLQRAGWM